jgi:hypothetical protein
VKAVLKGGRGVDIVSMMSGMLHIRYFCSLHQQPGAFATRISVCIHKGRRQKPIAAEKSKWDAYRQDILVVAGNNERPIKRREVDVVAIRNFKY